VIREVGDRDPLVYPGDEIGASVSDTRLCNATMVSLGGSQFTVRLAAFTAALELSNLGFVFRARR
jgi:hypothetical protein